MGGRHDCIFHVISIKNKIKDKNKQEEEEKEEDKLHRFQ